MKAMTGDIMVSMVCPQCKKDDAIQKLSTILASGTSSGLSGDSLTDLARLLQPPDPPKKPIKPTSLGSAIMAYLVGGSAVSLLTFFLIVPFVVIVALIFGPKSFDNNLGNRLIMIIGLLTLVAFTLMVSFLLGVRVYRKLEKDSQNSYLQAQEKYSLEKSGWDSAIKKWNRSYYCHRNGIVFDPENGIYCEPTALREFLYQSEGG